MLLTSLAAAQSADPAPEPDDNPYAELTFEERPTVAPKPGGLSPDVLRALQDLTGPAPTPAAVPRPAPADDELPPLLVLPKPDPTPKKILQRPPAPLTPYRGSTCADLGALTDARQESWPVGDTVFEGTVTRAGHWFRPEDPADHDHGLGAYVGLVRSVRPCVEAEWTSLWTYDEDITAWYRGDHYIFVSSEDTAGGLGLAVVDRRSIEQ